MCEELKCGICGKEITDNANTVEDVECGTCCAEHYEDEQEAVAQQENMSCSINQLSTF